MNGFAPHGGSREGMCRPSGQRCMRAATCRGRSSAHGGESDGKPMMATSSMLIFPAMQFPPAHPCWPCFMGWRAHPPATMHRPWRRCANSAAGNWRCRIFAVAAARPIDSCVPITPVMRPRWIGYCVACMRGAMASYWPWAFRWVAMHWRDGRACKGRARLRL